MDTLQQRRETLKEQVKKKILSLIKISDKGCWIWQGSTRLKYGRMQVGELGGRINVHRLTAWLYRDTKIWDERYTLHRCNNGLCCNPEHTYEGNQYRNLQDMLEAGTHLNKDKTHCIRGHAFDEKNTYINPGTGKRVCRICTNERRRK